MLRFLGVTAENASQVTYLRQRYKLPAPTFAPTSNPLDARLLAELNAYFAPFQAQLRKTLAAHRKCFAERTAAVLKKKKQMTSRGVAAARAG